ncbi:S41 family peptidase [Ligilactobacillus ubinensis]|uniref:S41 family peptidase n=1 Tax=Ligilactobacillus ubinensis TaxID=2876789 RepID=UPI003CC59678
MENDDKKEVTENKKAKKEHRKVSIWAVIITAVVAIAIGAGGMYAYMYNEVKEAQTVSASMKKIQTIYETLYYNYYKKTSAKKLQNGAINGMIDALDDQFSEYMTKSEAESLNDTISGSFVGIGVEVQKSGNYIKVIAPIDNTPAAKAGLKAKDLITKVNGKSIKGVSLEKVISTIRGKKGTYVTLTIQRDGSTFTKKVKRATIPVSTVYGNIDSKNKTVGYIKVTTFSTNTAKEFKKEIKILRKKGAKSFVIDVRDNPGGLMNVAISMASMFVKYGKNVMQVQGRNGETEVYKSSKSYSGGFKVTEPTVVLVNSGSASASEIFASALNESANIKLIGTKTYGKGTVQTTQEYKDGTELKLTIDKWLTANGTWINKKGIEPTIKSDWPSVAYLAAINTDKSYQEGQVSKQVKKIQKILKYLGYFTGTSNGYYGSDTKDAIAKFQSDNGITSTGTADKATVIKMESKLSSKLSNQDNAYKTALKQLTN